MPRTSIQGHQRPSAEGYPAARTGTVAEWLRFAGDRPECPLVIGEARPGAPAGCRSPPAFAARSPLGRGARPPAGRASGSQRRRGACHLGPCHPADQEQASAGGRPGPWKRRLPGSSLLALRLRLRLRLRRPLRLGLRTPLRLQRRFRPPAPRQAPSCSADGASRPGRRRLPASTRAPPPFPNPAACATASTSSSWRGSPVSSAAVPPPIHTTCALLSRARSAARSVTSSPCRCAGRITGKSTAPATNRHGGPATASSRFPSPQHYGGALTRCRAALPTKRSQSQHRG